MDFTLATVAYADVFDYPLTKQELSLWLIKVTKIAQAGKLQNKDGFYFLKGRSGLIQIRRERSMWQQEKWAIGRRAASVLSHIPTIQLVGVTGGLAMNNAKVGDDIDLFLVVSDGTLWISRLMATICMDILRLRRRPHDVTVTNKVCLNMFMTERGMGVSPDEQDCFSAHEVLQMQPVFDRRSMYKRFLNANTWVRTYLPNAWRYKNKA